MIALLSPKFWAAVILSAILAFAGFTVYRAGKASVRAEWNAQKLEDAGAARKAIEANRLKEQALQANLTKAQDDASKREKTLRAAAAGARSELKRLLDAIASATGGLLPSDTADTVLARAAAIGGLLGECSKEYSDLAAKADGHSSDALMLRDGWPKP